MDPIGTITKYYPFLEPEVRDIIDYVTREADDYREFVSLLGERVNIGKTRPVLAYLAVKHAMNTQQFDIVDGIAETHGDFAIVRPLIHMSSCLRGDREALGETLRAADKAILTGTDDWLTMEMHNIKLFAIAELANAHLKVPTIINEARRHLSNRDVLESLAFWVYWARGTALRTSGEHNDAVKAFQAALKIARSQEDPNEAAYALKDMAGVVKFSDLARALELYLEAADEFKALGNIWGSAAVLNSIGMLFTSISQYDDALECFSESIRLNESIRLIPTVPLLNLSWLYSDIGDGESAVEFARMGLNSSRVSHGDGSVVYSHANLAMAYALAVNDQFEEASRFLDTGLEAVVKVGSELDLMRYFLVRGLVEREKGDLEDAAHAFQRVLRSSERFGSPRYVITSLLRLAEIEISNYIEDSEPDHIKSATLYLSRIEQIAEEQNYPSVFVEVTMLKAELQRAKGLYEEARDTLREAVKICKSSGMDSLCSKVEARLARLDVDVGKPEIATEFVNLARDVVVPSKKTQEVLFKVLGCLVIFREGGFEVYARYSDDKLSSDPSLVSALISAVASFTQELREDAVGELHSIIHHDIAVLLEHGEYVTCALLADKDTYDARVLLRRFLERFEEDYGDDLLSFDGTLAPFRTADKIYELFLEDRQI
ncbi:MAG: tetratricopeptide repeat protein [Candidatus Thorarchaeota archaeon]|nr:MAG: tetratricopeptide repeat protein [Candidatus Thorarchaeota archaeon]